MINGVTMKINIDDYLLSALKEDITSEDVTTNAVMREPKSGIAELICKEDGIICGLEVFHRVFQLLDEQSFFKTEYKDITCNKSDEIPILYRIAILVFGLKE